jgi:hypothetical protein
LVFFFFFLDDAMGEGMGEREMWRDGERERWREGERSGSGEKRKEN